MRILVTGGAGFIGSNLVDELIKHRHNVIIIDDLSTGFKKNINSKSKFYKTDIENFKEVEDVFKKEKPEIIFHLAAQINLQKSITDPISNATTNILASINLIKLSRKYKIKKFIFSSTGGAIYGDTNKKPTNENYPEWPLSPYGITKLTIDKYLNYYYWMFNLKYVSLRYSNVYGPRQSPNGEAGVVAVFLNKMFNDKQPVINGDGKQTRDYVFVNDVVNANILALKNFKQVGVYNIGTGIEINVNQLFQEINEQFKNKFEERHGPAKTGEQKTSCLNYSKIKKEFGWEPKVNIKQGIKKTYDWFFKNADKKDKEQ